MGSPLALCPAPGPAFVAPGAVVGLDTASLVAPAPGDREEGDDDKGFSLLPDFAVPLVMPLLVAGRAPLVGIVFVGVALMEDELVEERPTGFVFNGRNPLVDFPSCSDTGAKDNSKILNQYKCHLW